MSKWQFLELLESQLISRSGKKNLKFPQCKLVILAFHSEFWLLSQPLVWKLLSRKLLTIFHCTQLSKNHQSSFGEIATAMQHFLLIV